MKKEIDEKKRITVSLSPEVADFIEEKIKERIFHSFSHAFEALAYAEIKKTHHQARRPQTTTTHHEGTKKTERYNDKSVYNMHQAGMSFQEIADKYEEDERQPIDKSQIHRWATRYKETLAE